MVEVHARPDEALSDGAQSLTLEEFEQMVRELKAIHEVTRSARIDAKKERSRQRQCQRQQTRVLRPTTRISRRMD